jgi:hypothetical protein
MSGASDSRQTPRIHQAALRSDGSVVKGAEISEEEAIVHRRSGGEVVVCGSNADANSDLAKKIEQGASGTYVRHGKHHPMGLNHYQPQPRPEGATGHTFYETKNSKARRR